MVVQSMSAKKGRLFLKDSFLAAGDPDAPAYNLKKWYGFNPKKLTKMGFEDLEEMGHFVHRFYNKHISEDLEQDFNLRSALIKFSIISKDKLENLQDKYPDLNLKKLRRTCKKTLKKGGWKNSNCYAYSANDSKGKTRRNDPGVAKLGNHFLEYAMQRVLDENREMISKDVIMELASFDGMEEITDFDEVINPKRDGFYSVALYIHPTDKTGQGDYHWARQNKDGTWSHQEYSGGDINITRNQSTNELVSVPHIDEPVHTIQDRGYFFSGYMRVPKGGIGVGADDFKRKNLNHRELGLQPHPNQGKRGG